MENKVTNVNEDIFTKKWEEYKKLLTKRENIKWMLQIINNTINYIKDYQNDENLFKKDISRMNVGCNLYENSIGWNLSLNRITDEEQPLFEFSFNAVRDMDVVLNMLKGVVEAYKIRYENINKEIKEFDFLKEYKKKENDK